MRGVRGVAAIAVLALFTTVAGQVPAAGAPRSPAPAPRQHDPAVPVTPVKPRAAAPDPAAAKAMRGTPKVTWPTKGVGIEVLDRPAGEPNTAMLLRLRRTDGAKASGDVSLTVDYSGFRQAYGGDWASRLRLVRRSDGVPLPTTNDVATGTLTARVPASGTAETFAVAAGPAGAGGSFKANPLPLQSTWDVTGQTGEFAWSYPLRLPEVPGTLAPQLAISYSSASVDGRTASTNNQPSWVGEGFDLATGYVSRSYKGCSEDAGNNGSALTGDQCWASDNATLAMAGHSGELVRDDATGVWKLKSDDGTRVERLYGPANGDDDHEYWKVTTTDGTQYFFGQLPQTNSTQVSPVFGNNTGEPCNKSTFAASWCRQGYQWNLDHVVDPRGNAIVYTYAKETNSYGLLAGTQTVSYDRAATLQRIDYGLRAGAEFAGTAPASVVFATAPRCAPGANCAAQTPQSYPDTPFDQACASNCRTQASPTFWSTVRLAGITTRVGATDVEKWTLDQDYPDPGDRSSPALSLKSIGHAGLYGGSVALPPVTFNREAKANRVDADTDGLPAMNKYRVIAINNETGGTTTVNYAPANCAARPAAEDTNTLRCFPVFWAPEGAPEIKDWMHKYVVDSITQVDNVGRSPTEVTSYEYVGGGAWHYNDGELIKPERRTWSDWRGYGAVVIRHGDATTARSVTEMRYFRGMNGDRLKTGTRPAVYVEDSQHVKLLDDDQLNGVVREVTTRNGDGGPILGTTITDPWQSDRPTAQRGSLKAYLLDTRAVTDYTALDGGQWRRTQVARDHDGDGQVTQIDDHGDLDVTGDETCTRTWYAGGLTTRSQVTATACPAGPAYPAELPATEATAVSDVRTSYDAAGLPSRVDQLEGVADYLTATTTTYDSYGRPKTSTDALGRRTTFDYVETAGLTTRQTITNNLGHTTTTELSPAWGEATRAVDANNRRTDVVYDPLGRVTGVWLPGRSKDALQGPNTRYTYNTGADRTNSVLTEALHANDNYVGTYVIYDGFMRPRQTQAPAWGGGRVLTDTVYDSRGLAVKSNNPYYVEGAPSGTLQGFGDQNIPSQTVTTFDGAARPLTVTVLNKNVPQWSSVSGYHGDHTDFTPPRGGTATSTYVDARGNTTALYQYPGTIAAGNPDITRYTYAKGGQLATVTDPAGNQWRYGFDLLGRRTTVHDPDAGDSSVTYDKGGQVLTATDGRGKTLSYAYDGLGRRTEERDNATGTLLAQWTYDRTPSTAGDGLTAMKGLPSGSTRYDNGNAYTTTTVGYDAANRPTGVQVSIPAAEGKLAGTYQTSVTYRPDGSLASTGLPSAPNPVAGDLAAETLTYDYDNLGMAKTLKGGGGYTATYVAASSYTRFAEPEQFAYGAAGKQVTSNFYYDETTRRAKRVLTNRDPAGGSTAPSAVDDFRYDYDPAGNVTRIGDEPDGGPADIQCFQYDHLRRMTDAWTIAGGTCPATPAAGGRQPYWTSYMYDKTGNRTSETQHGLSDVVRTYEYAPGGHTLSSVTTGARTDSYGYDKAGNTTTRPGQTIDWDVAGRLASARTAAGTTTFVYDADGARLLRREPGAVTLYLGDQEFRLDTATGMRTGTRYYSNGGATVAMRTGGSLYWLVDDRHGTATTLVGSVDLAVTRRLFTPFGDVRGPAPDWPGDHGFVDGVRDETLGLVQLGAREYDPGTGRFLSADPIVDPMDPQQLNGYAYANNSPATFSDPDGLRYIVDAEGYVSIPSLAHATAGQIKKAAAKAAKFARINKQIADKIKQRKAKAAKASGHSQKEIDEARRVKNMSVIDVVLEVGGDVIKEFLHIDEIKGCFGQGNLGSCLSLLVTAVPWGKIFEIGRLIGAVKKAWSAVKDFLRIKKKSPEVLEDVAEAEDEIEKLDDVVPGGGTKEASKPAAENAEGHDGGAAGEDTTRKGPATAIADGLERPGKYETHVAVPSSPESLPAARGRETDLEPSGFLVGAVALAAAGKKFRDWWRGRK
ncbi:RHS repeat-associated core domain-containing protein [Actinoplanes sp. NPDC051513]|uniref:RHS repeat-associated core domain-containing protein n=1 Tax=Actinoplanes sp. NPDC051513 TaxID=3363908 RepID=UPI0037901CFD